MKRKSEARLIPENIFFSLILSQEGDFLQGKINIYYQILY